MNFAQITLLALLTTPVLAVHASPARAGERCSAANAHRVTSYVYRPNIHSAPTFLPRFQIHRRPAQSQSSQPQPRKPRPAQSQPTRSLPAESTLACPQYAPQMYRQLGSLGEWVPLRYRTLPYYGGMPNLSGDFGGIPA